MARDTDSPPKDLVKYSSSDGIAVLTLNAPPANCYSYDMMRALDETILQARMDSEVHVIVLRGEGEFFCAGADISMLDSVTPEFKYYFCLHANETLNRLEQTPKLTIAAINGHCVGGGLEVAMACDFRVAKEGNGRVGLPEVNLGVLPGTGGTQRLARLLGKARAMDWMTTGHLSSVAEAADVGLIHRTWNAESFWAETMAFAKTFCPPNKASKAVGLIKRSVQTGLEVGFQDGLALERELQQQLFTSEDAKTGIAAYMKKATPEFRGK